MKIKIGYHIKSIKLAICLIDNFPDNYVELIDEIIREKSDERKKEILNYIFSILSKSRLNNLYSTEEVKYIINVENHISDTLKEYESINKIKLLYSLNRNNKYALVNWEEIINWNNLPFYKKWFKNKPEEKFVEVI